jgi:hypothetical protein
MAAPTLRPSRSGFQSPSGVARDEKSGSAPYSRCARPIAVSCFPRASVRDAIIRPSSSAAFSSSLDPVSALPGLHVVESSPAVCPGGCMWAVDLPMAASAA